MLRVWMRFFDTVLSMHQPTNGKQALSFFSEREMRPIQGSEKIRSRPKLVWKKRGLAFRLFAYICRGHTRFIFQVESRKFERGIAEKRKMIVIACAAYPYGNRVLAISLDG